MSKFIEALKHPSEQTLIEAEISLLIGVIIGLLASWVMILFITDWAWYFKLFASIGEAGILGMQLLAIRAAIIKRRNYLELLKLEKIETM